MRKFRAIMGAFVFGTICIGCEGKGEGTSSEKTVGGTEAIEQSIQTCVSDIGVELVPDDIEAPDALVVSFTSTDETVNQMLEQGNTVTLIVWKDTSTVIEDSAVYTSRIAKIRKVKDSEFQIFYPGMGFTDLGTNELSVISNEELRINPQITIKTRAGREWTFRSCQ
ncbi:hypothetical protein [Pontibacter actiniarum]|uniref:Uncharacterized protein n=1 Tax=Pontibacter actiniarum TaxID=323450 RepID=A0A1X9YM57_9BACT|nr:hypothetical protein [Pontibacter actiniarum]ARS33966.1 hypothetical protein CA264_00115 [Pontibacter actiniarum]